MNPQPQPQQPIPVKASVPVHLSERVFRRYESMIAQVVRNFPNATTFQHAPLSINTFTCRLRDAIKSVLTYHWPTPIDITLLEQIRPSLIVREQNGLVWAGLRTNNSENGIATEGTTPAPKAQELILTNPNLRDLYAIAHLLSERKLSGPVILINANHVDIDQVTAQPFDVAFREEGDRIYMF